MCIWLPNTQSKLGLTFCNCISRASQKQTLRRFLMMCVITRLATYGILAMNHHTPPCSPRFRGFESTELKQAAQGWQGHSGSRHGTSRSHSRWEPDCLLRCNNPAFTSGQTECSSCRIQMEQQAAVSTIHPLKMLAMAYGMLPHITPKPATNHQKPVLNP